MTDGESRCVGCGCTDARACEGGCSWLMVNRRLRIGVCSECETTENELKFKAAVRKAKGKK